MAPSGTGEGTEMPLECPRCASRVAWNGTEFVCLSCPWTERQEKPPSSRILEVPRQVRDQKRGKRK